MLATEIRLSSKLLSLFLILFSLNVGLDILQTTLVSLYSNQINETVGLKDNSITQNVEHGVIVHSAIASTSSQNEDNLQSQASEIEPDFNEFYFLNDIISKRLEIFTTKPILHFHSYGQIPQKIISPPPEY